MIFDDNFLWSLMMVFVDGLSSVHLKVDTAFAPKVQINTGLLIGVSYRG